ncbi:kappa-type opioid receptor-like [Stylophora pistillata]|uniref:kappa-type opioid receptor-like n=1 Tax=Stylophora pistillata TaxID=50429 RepID=UPI000C046E24|nr:kappa-type opioid receptor-like [Stylophora pistillata]
MSEQNMKNITLEETAKTDNENATISAPLMKDKPTAIFWCSFFILEALVITVGNLLTTVVFLRTRKLRKRRYYLMINLAISDMLVGALAIPMFVVAYGESHQLWNINPQRSVPVEVNMFFDMFAGFASIAFLAMIALERLYATLRPFNYRALKSGWYILFTATAWMTAGSVPTFHIMAMKFPTAFHSSTPKALVISMWVPFLSALLLLICASYIVIWTKVQDIRKSVGKRDIEKESYLSRICLLVTAVSLVTWLPFVIANLIFSMQSVKRFKSFMQLFYATKFLHFANSFLNPVLYVLKIPEFKERLSNLCRKKPPIPAHDLRVRLSRSMISLK